MATLAPHEIYSGPSSAESPGGFVFGPQGFTWGQSIPKGITFFLDNTCTVTDQYGRPIRGVVGLDNKPTLFAPNPPDAVQDNIIIPRPQYATHQKTIEALESERIDWKKLTCAGFPQLPYEELKKLPALPPTPIRELKKIVDKDLRKAAIKARKEADELRARELRISDEEDEG